MPETERDVFICHAGEDKQDIVRPMVKAFEQAGITCWLDEAEIGWGDSITQKVNEGLERSRYVIVVLSPAFIDKHWPKRELNAALNLEAGTGEIRVLPLVVGSREERERILAAWPLLNDKRYLPWTGESREIVEAMRSRLGHGRPVEAKDATIQPPGLGIPLPKIRKSFSQRDKDLFLREAFGTVKQYFETGLKELESAYEELQTDLHEVNSLSFRATVYRRGEVASRCKIWVGGLMRTDSIAYRSGEVGFGNDNSFNDLLTVDSDERSMGFRPSFMWPGAQTDAGTGLLTAQEAAAHLWLRFTDRLGA